MTTMKRSEECLVIVIIVSSLIVVAVMPSAFDLVMSMMPMFGASVDDGLRFSVKAVLWIVGIMGVVMVSLAAPPWIKGFVVD